MKNRLPILFIIIIAGLTARAQEAREIRLQEGLIIQNGVNYGRNNFVNDPQALQIISGSTFNPREGLVSGKDAEGRDATWERITADEEGYFRSDKLRGGGLYIEYESREEKLMILSASGHTMAFINGEPREGDHYDFNFSMQPVLIKKGLNSFYFTNGRYNRIKASLIEKTGDIIIKKKDLTLPDLVIEEAGSNHAGVTLINASQEKIKGLKLECRVGDESLVTGLPAIEKLTTRRVNFRIPAPGNLAGEEAEAMIKVYSEDDVLYDSYAFKLKVKHFPDNHDRTFISNIDGSVQYYSVTPGTRDRVEGLALILSVHGAGVQARNQAWTYDPKDWGHIVAPTNRGPFGFAWEDWGRLDALEVLEEGKELFRTTPSKTYLTGHSMGGHGTWHLGATYPDRFAAIAPCAGYPDLLGYASRSGAEDEDNEIKRMFDRAGNPSRTLKLARNYLHHGVYVYHGDEDPTVSVKQARLMRGLLGEFHPDFTYYEYPGGTHWYGDISMDWPPIFDYFKIHELADPVEVDEIEFYTASPGVSAESNWLLVYQQIKPFEISSVKADVDRERSHIEVKTENIRTLALNIKKAGLEYPVKVIVDKHEILLESPADSQGHYFKLEDKKWEKSVKPAVMEKGPHRYGGFKDAFRKNMVFVYGTNGSPDENRWNYMKARFDAETFAYRGNGSIETVTDTEYLEKNYVGRNIIIYGNADNNRAWGRLLANSPVQVMNNKITIGDSTFKGDNIGCYFIQPLAGSEDNSVGVIAGTGTKGMSAAYPNQYFIAGTSFPDLAVFRMPGDDKAYETVVCAGFFGNNWSVENGEFVWKKK